MNEKTVKFIDLTIDENKKLFQPRNVGRQILDVTCTRCTSKI